jgi:hypothetical protein
MGIIKNYHDKKWTLQFLDALYNSIDIDMDSHPLPPYFPHFLRKGTLKIKRWSPSVNCSRRFREANAGALKKKNNISFNNTRSN